MIIFNISLYFRQFVNNIIISYKILPMSDYDKEQIHDEEDNPTQHSLSQPPKKQQQGFNPQPQPQQNQHHESPSKQQTQHDTQEHKEHEQHHSHQHSHEHEHEIEEKSPKKDVIDHVGISKYASFTLDVEDDQKNQVYLRIVGVETKGSAFTKYTTYIIKGHDKNGQVNVCRRYSQFHALRVAMVHRWPGCFIPSIPTKNFMHKNDKDQTIKRQRYLNDFVIKMTKLPYLYNSEEFQTFLRSKQADISNIYSSWSQPTNQAIINKYRDCFSDLAGKTIDSGTNDQIGQFYAKIKKNAALLEKYRANAKSLALAYDKFQQSFPAIFSKVIPIYEKVMLFEYSNGKQSSLVYQNPEQAKLNQHATIVAGTTAKNPYWALYDMIKHEQRDGRAFLQALDARQSFENKKNSIQGKIKDNQVAIMELMGGKTNFKSVTMKGTKQQIKYKLEIQNQDLKKDKNMLLNLSDIISALIAYIEIPAYRFAKVNFYNKTIKKIGGFELNAVQIQADVWKDAEQAATKIGSAHQHGL